MNPFERKALQAAVAIAALVPVTAGAAGVIFGARGQAAAADSHFRYLSGILLGIGLVFWWMVPHIERRTAIFRALTVLVVVGGLARLYAFARRGDPGAMHWALAMELIVTPALCLWQARVAAKAFPA